MTEQATERSVLIRSRLAEGYTLSESGLKALQHVFTDWLPRALYYDLTDDTVSVDVIVRRDFLTGKGNLESVFKRQDGTQIQKREYLQDRLTGKQCPNYDPKKTKYEGNIGGFDHRRVFFLPTSMLDTARIIKNKNV